MKFRNIAVLLSLGLLSTLDSGRVYGGLVRSPSLEAINPNAESSEPTPPQFPRPNIPLRLQTIRVLRQSRPPTQELRSVQPKENYPPEKTIGKRVSPQTPKRRAPILKSDRLTEKGFPMPSSVDSKTPYEPHPGDRPGFTDPITEKGFPMPIPLNPKKSYEPHPGDRLGDIDQ